MTIGDRDRLLRRIRQIRRTNAASDQAASDHAASDHAATESPKPEPDRLQALEARVAHLEKLLEGLQDSAHREMERHAKLIAELQSQVDPGAMGAAIAEDIRNRGL